MIFRDGYLNIMLMMTCVLISICMGYILLIISFWVYVDYNTVYFGRWFGDYYCHYYWF